LEFSLFVNTKIWEYDTVPRAVREVAPGRGIGGEVYTLLVQQWGGVAFAQPSLGVLSKRLCMLAHLLDWRR
ncbi:hypothetical protein ACFLV7_15105, partial [Chloroflexota bacterium]